MRDEAQYEGPIIDPLGDEDATSAQKGSRNRARVGSVRPSSMIYTYGPGAIIDLPQFTVMPSGFDDWERIWIRRESIPTIDAPRLLDAVRKFLGPQVHELRPFPWAPKKGWADRSTSDLGVPARVFPQWHRCPACDKLGMISEFRYVNTNPYRADQATFQHVRCPGRNGRTLKKPVSTVPARFLLVCAEGHVDEFPYDWWVHRGGHCSSGVEHPDLGMVEAMAGRGSTARIVCRSCGETRAMSEAQGESGRSKLPRCRGRHPHLGRFDPNGCGLETRLMILGASNLWFGATQSVIVIPGKEPDAPAVLGAKVAEAITEGRLTKYRGDVARVREELEFEGSELSDLTDEVLATAVDAYFAGVDEEVRQNEIQEFDELTLLDPEWRYLARDLVGERNADAASGLSLSRPYDGVATPLREWGVSRVHAVDKLRKVNALLGFTRIDEMDRAADLGRRLVPLARSNRATWTVATEDRGEGLFIQLDENRVAAWEQSVLASDLWNAHRAAHARNFWARFSETARTDVRPDDRLPAPRYWLIHTLSHVLIRELAMYSGYSAASLMERIYAWPGTAEREPAAGFLIVTTASDSDGTLGGLVRLSAADDLERIFRQALAKAHRCSSDPVCAQRTPRDPEDFLHGAACHTCAMVSETSCERSNRFLDRRFLVDLPEGGGLGFFKD